MSAAAFIDPLRVGPELLAVGRSGGPLDGVTLAVKDVIDLAGIATGGGNPAFLEDAEPAARHAVAVQRLLDAGADVIGKAHTDELAFSLSGTNVHYGTPRNPRAPGRVPGGSSSGSASAVAGAVARLALGTDTGRLNPGPGVVLRGVGSAADPRAGAARWRSSARAVVRHVRRARG